MKVFMSWSGLRSKLTAELMHDWIKCVIQAAQPWISSRGIERGALWFSEINNELKDTAIGIICLTQENKNAPWILFESGALAKGLSSNRVCTFLIDLQPPDLQPPLAQFNHTFPNKESLWSLVTTLNSGLDSNRLDLPVLQRVFETYWPQFEISFNEILENNPPVTVVAPREDKDILAEILETTRNMSNRVRTLESRNNAESKPFMKFYNSGLAGSSFDRILSDGARGLLNPTNRELSEVDLIAHSIAYARDLLMRGHSSDDIRTRLAVEFGLSEPHISAVIARVIAQASDPDAKSN